MPAYKPPTLTIDAVIFQIIDNELCVLLIKRAKQPFKNAWALPGGYNSEGETTQEALARILDAKAGINIKKLGLVEQLYTFDAVGRDPRGHAVSVSYMGLGNSLELVLNPDSQNPIFAPVKSLPELAYDHASIIRYAKERLISKIGYSNAVFALLPPSFSYSELQSAYEAIYGRDLDKRNFRKQFNELELIEPTGENRRQGAHRPAMLYRFKKRQLHSFHKNFS